MGLLDNLAKEISRTSSDHVGQMIEDLSTDVITRRRSHERRWWDNNFFDDGYHFRVVSKRTGQVMDHAYQSASYVERAIPRASRQIRGVANLLFAAEPYPVIYPERITIEDFRMPDGQIDEQRYNEAREQNKKVARKRGVWLTTEWEEQDLPIKLIDLLLLASKNSVSWLQVYSDTDKQKICTDVYDAFDILVYGDRRETKDLPFIIKTCPMDIKEVMKDSRFNPAMVKKLTPDNKYATSEIKNAYMNMRYGTKNSDGKNNGTIMIKEGFLQQVLTEENWKEASKLGEENGAMDGKSRGDNIMRHTFSGGGVTLADEYIDYDEYPLIPFRYEPGPLYQVPFIERFIPQNKSLDVVVTRLEKWINSMVVGVYMGRKGENFQITNMAGGQKVEYETTPPAQMNIGSVGATPFNMVELLNKLIDEQGTTTSSGINVPSGVKSGVAIESIKATEYANLKISTLMLKKTIKDIAERMLERASKDYLEPKEVVSLEDGEPDYFDIIGERGFELSKRVNKELPSGIIPIKKDSKVRIEIEPGLGLTMQGKKDAMQQIIDYMIKMTEVGIVPIEAIRQVVKRFMEVFGYGSTQEFMEALDEGMTQADMDQDQITKIKIAMIEAMRDAAVVGPEAEKRLVDSTKVGVAETLIESGLIEKMNKGEQVGDKGPSRSISFKDLPPDGKAQLAAQAGIQINPSQIAADEQADKEQETVMKEKEI